MKKRLEEEELGGRVGEKGWSKEERMVDERRAKVSCGILFQW